MKNLPLKMKEMTFKTSVWIDMREAWRKRYSFWKYCKGSEGKERQGKRREERKREEAEGRGRKEKRRKRKASQGVIGLIGQKIWGAAAWTDRRYYLSSPVFHVAQLVQTMNLLCCFNQKGKQGR